MRFRDNKRVFAEGMRDGIPIGLGYFAVAFALGITAKEAGLNAIQGFIMSMLNMASAGEYAGIASIAGYATLFEIAVITLIANARYLLMSFAMSQRLDPGLPIHHRFIMAIDVTDELFGIAISRKGSLNPYYSYGAALIAAPLWSIGTSVGIIAGMILPVNVVSALGVALFGMFISIIIPPARQEKVVLGLVIISFAASFAASKLPMISDLSSGTRTIILTLVICIAASILFPREPEDPEEEAEELAEVSEMEEVLPREGGIRK